jgi:MFS transporter, NNP family, nitrate/nitrite transporter
LERLIRGRGWAWAWQGDFSTLKRQGRFQREVSTRGLTSLSTIWTTYLLALHYAASFGVELTVFNMLAAYLHQSFGLPKLEAGRVAVLCGITNIFSRGAGGALSDLCNRRWGMTGRLGVHFAFLLASGMFLLVFARMTAYAHAITLLLLFGICVQAANGTCFAIVPYVDEAQVGTISGVVGAGGNLGAMIFTLIFIFGELPNTAAGFMVMGVATLVAAGTVPLLGLAGLSGKATSGGGMDQSHHSSGSKEEVQDLGEFEAEVEGIQLHKC